MVSQYFVPSYKTACVFHLLHQIFNGISICNICNIDGIYDILIEKYVIYWKEFGIPFAVSYGPNTWKLPTTFLNIYSPRLYFHPPYITIEKLLWFIQIQHAPKPIYFVSKMFVTVSQLRTRCSLPYTIFPVTRILQVKVTLCSNLLKQSTFPSIPFVYYTQTLVPRPPPALTIAFHRPTFFVSTHNYCWHTPIASLIREKNGSR